MTIFRASEEFNRAAVMQISIETNGFIEGDRGHGGYAEVVLSGSNEQDLWVDGQKFEYPNEIKLRVYGGSEVQNLADAMRFCADCLDRFIFSGTHITTVEPTQAQ